MEVGGFILIEANKGETPAIVRLLSGLAGIETTHRGPL
jgi:hypothetical protein